MTGHGQRRGEEVSKKMIHETCKIVKNALHTIRFGHINTNARLQTSNSDFLTTTTFKNYSGMVFLIANLFLLYTSHYAQIIIIAAFSLICVINIIGFITSFQNYQKIINPNFFYFLLYLCALELGPYVLLYKVISEYNA